MNSQQLLPGFDPSTIQNGFLEKMHNYKPSEDSEKTANFANPAFPGVQAQIAKPNSQVQASFLPVPKASIKKEPQLLPTQKASSKSKLSSKSSSKKKTTTLTHEEKAELARLDLENMRPDRTRRRKTKNEIEMLEAEYIKNPNWSFEMKCRIALRLKMSATQVSKWLWERNKLN